MPMMKLYDVYGLFDIEPVSALGNKLYTADGTEYTDFYGGHAVISIGHSHPHFVQALKEQMDRIIFYSNSVQNPLQQELADKLGAISGCSEYELFLCNSGAEANENAIKLASFETGRSKILAIKNGFHGRTSAAVNATDNESIKAPINKGYEVCFIEMNDMEALEKELASRAYAAIIIEPIQGVGGLDTASNGFLKSIEQCCAKYGSFFIADEVQSGFGRSGTFFAFQQADVQPDIISMAKGMGNGFPIGGILIDPKKAPAKMGRLGTTFGGNHLACAASIAVIDVLNQEHLLENAAKLGAYLHEKMRQLPGVKSVKGKGLMIGLAFNFPIKNLREKLLYEHHIFTGNAKDPNVLRILPPLTITLPDADHFIEKLELALVQQNILKDA